MSKDFFDPLKFVVQKFWVKQYFVLKEMFQKSFSKVKKKLGEKNGGSKKIVDQKKLWVAKKS